MTNPRNRRTATEDTNTDLDGAVTAEAAALEHNETGIVTEGTPLEEVTAVAATSGLEPSKRQRRVGDPTAVLHEPVPDVSESEVSSGESIGNSTNALTVHCMTVLGGRTDEVRIETGVAIEGYSDLDKAFQRALGTTNIEQGAYNTAIRSNNYKYTGGHGQRAAVVEKDGTVVLLPNGTKYAAYYRASQDDNVAASAIIYFDQRETADNPFVSVRKYRKRDLPKPAGSDDDSL